MKQLILLFVPALLSIACFAIGNNAALQYSVPNSNADLKYTTPVTRELGLVDGYLEHLPPGYATNPNKKYPLIVYLHGTGERGNGSTDLYKIARVGDPSRRVEENGSLCVMVNGVQECFIVISPQLNFGSNWTAASQEKFWKYILEQSGYRIDPERVYLTGHSLGGNGVWEAAYSDFNSTNVFAAIAPLSYWTTTSKVCKVADRKVPVWAFWGAKDGQFINQCKAAINTLKNCQRDASIEIKSTEIPNLGHSITGPVYRVDHSMFNPNLYEWLLSKRRVSSGSTAPTVPGTPGQLQAATQSSSSIKITWNDNASNEDGFKIERSVSPGSGFVQVATVGANAGSFTNSGLLPSTTYYYRIRSYNGAGNSAYTSEVNATTSLVSTEGSFIVWTNINGAVQNGNDLEKTAPYGWGNSGAESSQVIATNSDGWIEMVIRDASKTDLAFGLSDINTNDNLSSVDFGFELSKYNGAFWKRENSNREYLGTYQVGDVLRVSRSGNTMNYQKNGQTISTTNLSSTPSLRADVAFLDTGATVFSGRISASTVPVPPTGGAFITWTNINGAVQNGSDLEKTAAYGWGNSGAESSQTIAANSDGWIEMVIRDVSKTDLVFGLSDININDNIGSTGFGFELSKYNNAFWKREHSDRVYLGTYKVGDVLRIERSGNTIIYQQNGQPISTTIVTSAPSLIADAAMLDAGSTVFSGRISSTTTTPVLTGAYIVWTNINGATQKGNNLEKIAAYGWGNSGAESSQTIAANSDGWIEMVIRDVSKTDLVFGLSDANLNDNLGSTDFGFELSKYNAAFWKRENANREYLGTYKMGDVLRIERAGNTIIYSQNGQPISTTFATATPLLLADAAFLDTGATLFDGKISANSVTSQTAAYVNWININGGIQTGNELIKTAEYGWGNSGAESSQAIASGLDGWVEMVIVDAQKADVTFGLSASNLDDRPETINYGFEVAENNRALWRRENSSRVYLGTYAEADVLRVERKGSNIVYKKNGTTVATTAVTSSPRLVADASLIYTGATVYRARIFSAGTASSAVRTAYVADTSTVSAADSPTALEEVLLDELKVVVYPNPLGEEGVLHLNVDGHDFKNAAIFLLFDLSGNLILQRAITSVSTEIPLQQLPRSMYIYRLMLDGVNTKSGRIIR